jgi:hypothetical protein
MTTDFNLLDPACNPTILDSSVDDGNRDSVAVNVNDEDGNNGGGTDGSDEEVLFDSINNFAAISSSATVERIGVQIRQVILDIYDRKTPRMVEYSDPNDPTPTLGIPFNASITYFS